MQFLSYILFASLPLMASSQSAAFWAGNNDAAALWDQKAYKCTLNDVANEFWLDVKDEVFDQCKQKYNLFPKSLQECKDGAEAYTITRANDCAKDYECEALGQLAAGSVADKHCPRRPPKRTSAFGNKPPPLIPPRCEKKAKSQCKDVVENEVFDRIDKGVCTSLSWPLSNKLTKKLKKQCDQVVEGLVDEASLP